MTDAETKLNEAIKCLSYREREIIKLRYGIGDGYNYTLEEVGHIFKVTRERIRQIEAKAIRKLQAAVGGEEELRSLVVAYRAAKATVNE